MNCPKCGKEFQDNLEFCPYCSECAENNEVKAPGMKWYKFQAYFLFPVNAILSLISSVLFLPGVLWKLLLLIPDSKSTISIYNSFYFLNEVSVKVSNTIFAFVIIAYAFYYMYIAFSLIKFKKGALNHIYISLVLSEGLSLLYLVLTMILTKNLIEFDAETIIMSAREVITHAVSVVFRMMIYTKYYNKRKYMFVN